MASNLIESLRSLDLRREKPAIREDSTAARKAQPVVEAGRLAFLDALRVLQENGADLNASWRGYRALHALIQERTHGACPGPDPRRIACLSGCWRTAPIRS